jgi:chemotaxis protein MotB
VADSEKPTIVRKRIIKGGGAAHSSAWKIAFADFAVAMMAFFMVMWLMNVTSPEEKEAISGYFANPAGYKDGGFDSIINFGGSGNRVLSAGAKTEELPDPDLKATPTPKPPASAAQEKQSQTELFELKKLAYELKKKISENPALEPYQDQVAMNIDSAGLEIQIMDKSFRPMFDSGSDVIKPHMQSLLQELGKSIGALPNKIHITGHTDATVYTGRQNYSNWELSADRANTARRTLESFGVQSNQVSQVAGKGSSDLHDKQHPESPVNRRLSILILNVPPHARRQHTTKPTPAASTTQETVTTETETVAPKNAEPAAAPDVAPADGELIDNAEVSTEASAEQEPIEASELD